MCVPASPLWPKIPTRHKKQCLRKFCMIYIALYSLMIFYDSGLYLSCLHLSSSYICSSYQVVSSVTSCLAALLHLNTTTEHVSRIISQSMAYQVSKCFEHHFIFAKMTMFSMFNLWHWHIRFVFKLTHTHMGCHKTKLKLILSRCILWHTSQHPSWQEQQESHTTVGHSSVPTVWRSYFNRIVGWYMNSTTCDWSWNPGISKQCLLL